jgi:hypothetical protein
MLPIWSEFISTIKHDSGSSFKEDVATKLIDKSRLYSDKAIEKLLVYIDKTTAGRHINNPSLTLQGISTEYYLEWMLSTILVRRITVGDISGIEPKINLVTSVYSYVSQKVNSENIGREFKNKVSDTAASSEMDKKLSVLEMHKAKEDVPIGSIMELEVALSDVESNAYRLAPNLNNDVLLDALETSKVLMDADIGNAQVTILALLYSVIVPTRAVRYINKQLIVKCLASAQAVLHTRGHHFLALLVTSKMELNNDIVITGVESRNRIPAELIEEINKYFPYQRKESTRKKTKEKNLALISIDKLAQDISSVNLTTTASRQFLDAASNNRTNLLVIPSDLKVQLARFVIDIVKMKSINYEVTPK